MEKLDQMLKGMLKKKELRKRWFCIAAMLSVLVFIGVTWRLVMPVITMTVAPTCGVEEHTHSSECYSELLSCEQNEHENHTHTEECYVNVLACGMEEHTHSDTCYPEQRVTVTFIINNEDYSEHLVTTEHEYHKFEQEERTGNDQETIQVVQEEQEYLITGCGVFYRVELPQGTSLSDNELKFPEIRVVNPDAEDVRYQNEYEWVLEETPWKEETVVEDDVVLAISLKEETNEHSDEAQEEKSDVNLDEEDHSSKQEHTNTYTVTFLQTDPTDESKEGIIVETIPVTDGTAIGNHIVTEKSYDDYMFQGWYYAQDNKAKALTIDTVIEQDLTVSTQYTKIQNISAKKPKKLPGAGNSSNDVVSVTVSGDTTTIKITANEGEALTAADFVIDGVNYADSSRYSWKDQTGKVVDIQSLLSDNLLEDVHLTLTNTTTTLPETGRITKSVIFETSGNTTTISIRVNVGDTLEASDFIYNGIDYRQYTWKKSGTDEAVDLNDLIGVPLTQELLNEIGTYQYTDDNSSQNIQTAVGAINFYVNIAGTWEKVTGTSIPVTLRRLYITQNSSTSYTYVITASQLESIYGTYGFRAADQEAGLTIFRHGTKSDSLTGSETAWADRRPFEYDGTTYVQLLKETPECNVYYLPGDALETGNREVEASKTLDSMVEANTLYSVKAENAEGTQMDHLPATMYVLKGSTTDTITLPQPPEGYLWGSDLTTPIGKIVSADANQITYQFVYNNRSTIVQNTVLTPRKTNEQVEGKRVRLWVSEDGEWKNIGNADGEAFTVYKVPYVDVNHNVQRQTYALKPEQLTQYYQQYGYKESDVVVGESLFQHATDGSQSIYSNRAAFTYQSGTYIPLLNHDSWSVMDLYYMPADKTAKSQGYRTKEETKEKNTFYSITMTNPDNVDNIVVSPEVKYVLRGTTETLEVPKLSDDYFWSVNHSMMDEGVVNGNTVTYTFKNISESKTLTPIRKGTVTTRTATLHFFASIDGTWQEITSKTYDHLKNVPYNTNYNRTNAISAEELEEIYHKYGYQASDVVAGEALFYHAGHGSNNIWGDRGAFVYLDSMYIPLSGDNQIDVYYMPKDKELHSQSVAKTALQENNTFYSVTVSNPNQIAGIANEYLTTTYVLNDGTGTVKLPKLDTGYWVSDGSALKLMDDHGDGTATYILEHVTKATHITAVADETVTGKRVRALVSVNAAKGWNDRASLWYTAGDSTTVNLLKTSSPDADGVMRTVYAVAAEDLVQMYGAYGFQAEDVVPGESLIHHVLKGNWSAEGDYLDGGTPAFEHNGKTYVPVMTDEELDHPGDWSQAFILYMPNRTTPSNQPINQRTEAAYADNTLWSIEVQKPDNVPYMNPGASLPETQFVINGRDAEITLPKLNSTEYTWSVPGMPDGEPIDHGNGTVTYKVTDVTERMIIQPEKLDEEETKKIRFWVSINEQWTMVEGKALEVPIITLSNDNSLLSYEELENVYGNFGFKADELKKDLFKYSKGSVNELNYLDPITHNGKLYQRVRDDAKWITSDLYYLPTAPRGNVNGDDHVKTNSFYSITVEDPLEISGYSAEELPEVQYVFRGGNAEVTLPPLTNGRTWVADGMTLTSGTKNADGSTTYVVNNIRNKIAIHPKNDENVYKIRYEIGPDPEELRIDLGDVDEKQIWDADSFPNVEGSRTHTVTFNSARQSRYTLLYPSDNFAQTYKNFALDGNKGLQRYTYTFDGWKINGDREIRKDPGEVLTGKEIAEYANALGEIVISPRWHIASDPNEWKMIESVGFYVQIDSKIHDRDRDNSNPENYTHNRFYSDSVFTTAVYNGKYVHSVDQDMYNRRVIAPEDSSDTGINADARIRKLASEGYATRQTVNGVESDVTVKLAEFPSDEEVLANLRNWSLRDPSGAYKNLTVDGQQIPLDQLTTKNFTIRWYVFKYDDSNGWHIDGLLIPKKGRITIKKTFMGDETTIENVKRNKSGLTNDYQIVLKSNREDEDDTILTLNGEDGTIAPKADVSDPSKHTYVWEVEINQLTKYTINEKNYLGGNNVSTDVRYSITNSEDNNDTDGLVSYEEDKIQATGFAYNTDQSYLSYQTVALENEYRNSETVSLRKIDAKTGLGMPGVTFTMTDANEAPVTIYQYRGTYYLTHASALADAGSNSFTTLNNGQMVTDDNGMIYIVTSKELANHIKDNLPNGMQLNLTETAKEGYQTIEPIRLILTGNNTFEANGTLPEGVTVETDTINNVKTWNLKVENQPETTRLTVVKEWPNTAESDKQQVTVALVKNGNRMDANTKIIHSGTDWTATWENLPLYENGQAVSYSVQEMVIGDDPMTAEYYDLQKDTEDGFTRYTVTYDSLLYRYNDGSESKQLDPDKIDQLQDGYLVVRNSEFKKNIVLTKIDFETGHPLENAVFALYSSRDDATDDRNRIQTSKGSTEGGYVSFDELRVATYYIKEVEAPYGYKLDSDNIYIAKVERYGFSVGTLLDANGTVGTALDHNGNAIHQSSYITNSPLSRADLKLLKQDNQRKNDGTYEVLKDAGFQLWYYNSTKKGYIKVPADGMTVAGQTVRIVNSDPYVTTAENGTAGFTGLLPGRYQITEEKSPDGYYKLLAPIEFTVTEDGAIKNTADGNDVWEIKKESKEIVLTIKNQKGEKLPMTGGTGTLPYIAGGLLLVLATLLMIHVQRCKYKREEVR